jgi:hypothetical protein
MNSQNPRNSQNPPRNSQLPARPSEHLSPHLSEEAFNDLLIGIRTPAAEAHLAACEQCRSQVAGFHADLQLFNAATLAWSESRAASVPPPPARPQPRFAASRPMVWSAAMAALALGAFATWNYQRPHTAPATSVASEFTDSPDQIAEDNQLLHNVYSALDEQPQSPVNEFSIPGGSAASNGSDANAPTKAWTQ